MTRVVGNLPLYPPTGYRAVGREEALITANCSIPLAATTLLAKRAHGAGISINGVLLAAVNPLESLDTSVYNRASISTVWQFLEPVLMRDEVEHTPDGKS